MSPIIGERENKQHSGNRMDQVSGAIDTINRLEKWHDQPILWGQRGNC